MLKNKQSDDHPPAPATAPVRTSASGLRIASPTFSVFCEALAPVLVEPPVYHPFSGAIERPLLASVWVWIERDIAPDEVAAMAEAIAAGMPADKAFDAAATGILEAIRARLASEAENLQELRRNTVQLGGDETRRRLPQVIMALRRRQQLAQAAQFGRSLGFIQDEAALTAAIETITIHNPVTKALWLQAMMGAVTNPTRVVNAAVKLSGGGSDHALEAAGFAPLIDAVLAHAQNQLSALMAQPGVFTDVDLACRAVDRFHRLMRSLNSSCEFSRRGHWASIATDLTGRVSERLERPLRQVTSDVSQALRRVREDGDRIDPDLVLSGLNGLYLLTTIRRSRDSLAVNTVLDQVWTETGQALEILVTRALDIYRKNPANPVARERLDAGIQMAEIRYNAEYADILRRARDAAERRTQALGGEDNIAS